jgi:5-methylcytosine-specific restriction endonuclease McrA
MNAILVLNADLSPISVTSLKKGFKLVYKGKADVLHSESENPIITFNLITARPTVIRLKKYIVFPYKKIPLTRQNIFKRDGNICTYCGSKKDLTLDHIQARSKGGQNSWMNLITSCFTCNLKKADRTPEEAGMIMNIKPFIPNATFFMSRISNPKKEWLIFMPKKEK